MKSTNIPEVRLGIVAVSRDCFPIALSTRRRQNIVTACKTKGFEPYECSVTVENETDMLKAVEEVKAAGCNALTVFLGNFGPETPETLIAKYFDGPVMYVAAAEGDGDMINGRGDAYCGMLNCSYNLGMRHLKAYIPEYPVGTAEELADKIAEFLPIARAVLGVKNLKIITFGPRPQDFFACNAPIKGLYELGVEVEENSELDQAAVHIAGLKAELGRESRPALVGKGHILLAALVGFGPIQQGQFELGHAGQQVGVILALAHLGGHVGADLGDAGVVGVLFISHQQVQLGVFFHFHAQGAVAALTGENIDIEKDL